METNTILTICTVILQLTCIAILVRASIHLVRLRNSWRTLAKHNSETNEVLELMTTLQENMVKEISRMNRSPRNAKPWQRPVQGPAARFARKPSTPSADAAARSSAGAPGMTSGLNAASDTGKETSTEPTTPKEPHL